ncbi:MAG: hypothetical protein ACOX9C_04325 [Kiritimatiellia bacterium]|jgi:hypothetical protein
MARKKDSGCGTLLFIGIVAGVAMGGLPQVALGVFLVGGVLLIFAKPPKCGVCGQRTGGKTGVVRIGRRKVRACANCVRNVQAKISRAAVRNLDV